MENLNNIKKQEIIERLYELEKRQLKFEELVKLYLGVVYLEREFSPSEQNKSAKELGGVYECGMLCQLIKKK